MSSTTIDPPAATAARGSNLWILGSWYDLALLVATPLLIIPLVYLARLRFSIEDIALFVVAFGATGHHLPGMMRAYGDRELFKRFRVRFVVAPVFLIAVCLIFYLMEWRGLVVLFLLWGVWHGLMQVYGFARIYDAKVKSFAPWTVRLDFWTCVAWFGMGLLYSPGRMLTLMETFYQAGGPLLPAATLPTVRVAWTVGTAIITVAFLVNYGWRWKVGTPPSAIKVVLLISSFSFWWYAMVAIENVVLGIALFEIFHDVQYLTIVWIFNRKRVDSGQPVGSFTRFLFRRSQWMIGLYVGLVFAYGYAGFLPEQIDHDLIRRSLLALLIASGLLHFYYDGFIWKVREQSTRQSLGLQGGKAETSSGGLPKWCVHGLKWTAFVVPLFVLGVSQSSGVPPTLDQYQNLADAVPQSVAARLQLAHELVQAGRRDEALKHFQTAVETRPRSADAHFNLANELAAQGKTAEAREHFQLTIECQPTHARAHNNLGDQLREGQDFDGALRHYRVAVELDAGDPVARNNLAMELYRRGFAQQAIQELRTLVEGGSADANAHNSYGNILSAQGSVEGAAEQFRLALALDETFSLAHFNLANALWQQRNGTEAILHYEEALRHDSQYAKAHHALAAVLTEQGDHRKARDHFRQAQTLNPQWALPLFELAWLAATSSHDSVRDAAEAMTLARRALELAPAHPRGLEALAAAHAAAGDYAAAEQAARQALDAIPPQTTQAAQLRARIAEYQSQQGASSERPPNRN